MLYILIAVLMFGILIAVHEFGHFITAKLLGVRVNEFAIGMGPKLLSWQKGETLYSLRLLPIGGFCAMEGEDSDTGDAGSFSAKPAWKRLIILAAGSAMNFLTGVLLILVLFSQAAAFYVPTLGGFIEGYGLEECGLQPGDRFLEIDGHRVFTYSDVSLLLSRAGDTVDLVVERSGARLELGAVHMPRQERTDEQGTTYLRGITIGAAQIPATLGNRLKMTVYQAADYVRMVWMSLGDLVTGAVGVQDLSGPIGIVSMIGAVGEEAETTADAAFQILNFVAFIAINLAVMNLLPIPALDGGRILFLAVNGVFTLVTRKKLDPKYEGYVNMAGFVLLLALMAFVAFHDIWRLMG